MARYRYLARASRDASTFNGAYQTLGSAFSIPPRVLKIVNNSDTDLDISTDGSTDHDIAPKKSYLVMSENELYFESTLQIYVKGAGAGTGNVYLVAMEVV